MASETEALLRRIATLEAQVEALRQVIEVGPSGVTLRSSGALSLSAAGPFTLKSGGMLELQAQSTLTLRTMQGLSLTGNAVTLSAFSRFEASGGKTVDLVAGDGVSVKSGAAALTLKKDGNTMLDGRDITLKASGRIDAKSSADLSLRGSKISQN